MTRTLGELGITVLWSSNSLVCESEKIGRKIKIVRCAFLIFSCKDFGENKPQRMHVWRWRRFDFVNSGRRHSTASGTVGDRSITHSRNHCSIQPCTQLGKKLGSLICGWLEVELGGRLAFSSLAAHAPYSLVDILRTYGFSGLSASKVLKLETVRFQHWVMSA